MYNSPANHSPAAMTPGTSCDKATRMLYRHFFRVLPEECTRPRRGEAKEKKHL